MLQRCYNVKIGLVVLENKNLTEDRHQPIAIGHLNDTGTCNLKYFRDNISFGVFLKKTTGIWGGGFSCLFNK